MIRACWDDNVDVRPTFANMAPRLAVALAAVNASPPPELDTPIEGMHNVYARSCVMYKYGAVRLLQICHARCKCLTAARARHSH